MDRKIAFSESSSDPVNSPEHYTQGSMETIEVLRAKLTPEGFRGYCQGCVIKYMTRFELKGRPLQDLKKARWYCDYLIKLYEDLED